MKRIYQLDKLTILPVLALWALTGTAEAGNISMAAYAITGLLLVALMAAWAYITGLMYQTAPWRRRKKYERKVKGKC